MHARSKNTATHRPMSRAELSLVVPAYNEGPAVDQFLDRVTPVLESLGVSYEIVFVDDGSADDTLQRLTEHRTRNRAIRIVALSRNFGKEAATTAGLDHARGAAVVPMDCDLQDPPEMLAPMLAKWREGFEVVVAQRSTRQGENWPKRWTAAAFYRVFNRVAQRPIPNDSGDFRLLDQKVVRALRRLPERTRFMKGLFSWVGFRQAIIQYEREPRCYGQSKWNYWKLWNLAVEGIVSFSSLPLRVWTYLGAMGLAVCGMLGLLDAAVYLARGASLTGLGASGWLLAALGNVQLVVLGILGEYLGRVLEEIKGRPVYIVARRYGFRLQGRRTVARAPGTVDAKTGDGRTIGVRPPAAA